MIDLHTHTVFSDGSTTPERNAELAAEAGLAGLALTDHDTFDGWDRMAAACARHRLAFVPGVELSAEVDDGHSVHLLGYWVDPADAALSAECARLRTERERRARIMVDRLVAHGLAVQWERVAAIAGDAPIGRPHLAVALVELGAVPDVDSAFAEWLAEDGPVWEPKHALSPAAAVRLIAGAGGVAVLAHPGTTFADEQAAEPVLESVAAAGLVGLEAEHAAHDDGAVQRWTRASARHDLLVTGSSDFHGDRKSVRIGKRGTPQRVVDALRERGRGGMRW